jgi:hypothetical protein
VVVVEQVPAVGQQAQVLVVEVKGSRRPCTAPSSHGTA